MHPFKVVQYNTIVKHGQTISLHTTDDFNLNWHHFSGADKVSLLFSSQWE